MEVTILFVFSKQEYYIAKILDKSTITAVLNEKINIKFKELGIVREDPMSVWFRYTLAELYIG